MVEHLPNTHEVLVQVQELPNFKTKLYSLTQEQKHLTTQEQKHLTQVGEGKVGLREVTP